MSTLEIKGGILDLISKIEDKKRLLKIKKMVLEFVQDIESDEEVIGYDAEDNPLTQAQLLEKLKIARESAKNGNIVDHNQFKEEVQNW